MCALGNFCRSMRNFHSCQFHFVLWNVLEFGLGRKDSKNLFFISGGEAEEEEEEEGIVAVSAVSFFSSFLFSPFFFFFFLYPSLYFSPCVDRVG